MKSLIVGLVLTLLAAASAPAQNVSIGVEYTHIGPPTAEPDDRVRIGSADQFDLSYSIQLSGSVSDNLDGYSTIRLMPTNLCVWPNDGPFDRPRGCDHGLLWSTLSFGLKHKIAEAGIGIASISGAKHDSWGAVPMHSPMVEAGASPTVEIGDFRIGPNCTGQLVFPNLVGDGFTVLERWAGIGPDRHGEGEQPFGTVNCGLRIQI